MPRCIIMSPSKKTPNNARACVKTPGLEKTSLTFDLGSVLMKYRSGFDGPKMSFHTGSRCTATAACPSVYLCFFAFCFLFGLPIISRVRRGCG